MLKFYDNIHNDLDSILSIQIIYSLMITIQFIDTILTPLLIIKTIDAFNYLKLICSQSHNWVKMANAY